MPSGTHRREQRRDAWIGVVTAFGAALYLILIPWQVQPDHDGFARISGRTVPYLIGATMLVLGALLCGLAARRARHMAPGGKRLFERDPVVRVAVYTGAIALYTVGIEQVGYMTSSAVMLLFAMWFSGARNRLVVLASVLVTPVVLYGVFHLLMQIPMPETPLY